MMDDEVESETQYLPRFEDYFLFLIFSDAR